MRAMIAVMALMTASILLLVTAGGCEKTIKEGVNHTSLSAPGSR
jgi:hypothetical protein